ncbi:MAG: catalase [Armatimonadota bacterium]
MASRDRVDEQSKNEALEPFREEPEGTYLTTSQGVRITHTDDSLKAGGRGPTLMEDFHFREKMTHFDHERIPERVVHARGSAAHGYFQVYEPLTEYTKAKVFQDPSVKTPVFVRFSTVVGFRGSADTVRDVRGFATKFYTEDGNWDLVGNNMPVFFIQDGIKFPDLVHAIKPQPHHEMPQASAAHDNFWDFISLMPEAVHMIMWVFSDRALPRSYAMMEGFGVHTFRLINEQGKARLVKFHWRPVLGVHSLVWDETQKIAGKDPDFNRRDLWERIEMGDYPEFELGLQIVEEADEHKFDFDLLDPTKIIPEEEVPVKIVGKMVLNRNPDNFFAETEQAAFHPGHVVPGIDFTNDPLLQARLFSYLDTQLIRLGGPNFAELPINRPVVEVHNNQRDGYGRQTINKGPVNYFPNSRGGGCPMLAPESMGGYAHYMEKVEGRKVRERSDSFKDHFSQATLFWNSMSAPEKQRIIEAAHFEWGKVEDKEIRKRLVDLFNHVDHEMAKQMAASVGVEPPAKPARENHGKASPALSMETTPKSPKTRKVAILAMDGFDHSHLSEMRQALAAAGVQSKVVSQLGGTIKSAEGQEIQVDKTFVTTASVLFDAVYVPGGEQSARALRSMGDAVHFVSEAFRHCKPVAATGEGVDLLAASRLAGVSLAGDDGNLTCDHGVVTWREKAGDTSLVEKVKDAVGLSGDGVAEAATAFVAAIAAHRHWDRVQKEQVPA